MTENKSLIIQSILKSTASILRLILVLLRIFNHELSFQRSFHNSSSRVLLSLSLFFPSAYFCLVFFGCGCILRLFRVFLFHWGGIIWFMVSNNFLNYISTRNSLSSFLVFIFLSSHFSISLFSFCPELNRSFFFPKAESPFPSSLYCHVPTTIPLSQS